MESEDSSEYTSQDSSSRRCIISSCVSPSPTKRRKSSIPNHPTTHVCTRALKTNPESLSDYNNHENPCIFPSHSDVHDDHSFSSSNVFCDKSSDVDSCSNSNVTTDLYQYPPLPPPATATDNDNHENSLSLDEPFTIAPNPGPSQHQLQPNPNFTSDQYQYPPLPPPNPYTYPYSYQPNQHPNEYQYPDPYPNHYIKNHYPTPTDIHISQPVPENPTNANPFATPVPNPGLNTEDQTIATAIRIGLLDLIRTFQSNGTKTNEDSDFLVKLGTVMVYGGLKKRYQAVILRKWLIGLGYSYTLCAKIMKIAKSLEDNTNTRNTFHSTVKALSKRKLRKNASSEIAKSYIDEFCHDDNNPHQIDSNDKKMTIRDGVSHPRRIWDGYYNYNKKYQSFLKSQQYTRFCNDHPDLSIGRTIFHSHICPCLKNPTKQSCVDIIMSGIDQYLKTMREILRTNLCFRRTLETCDCEHCKKRKDDDKPSLATVFLSMNARMVIESTCCEAVDHPDLSVGVGSSKLCPKFVPWNCVFQDVDDDDDIGDGSCTNCGLDFIFECDTISEMCGEDFELYKCSEWTERKLKSRTQWELHSHELTFDELAESLNVQMKRARRHWVTYQWSDHALRRIREAIDPDKAMTICTDFAATMNLEATLSDNSAVPMHGVLAIYFCYSGHRCVDIIENEQVMDVKQLIRTEVFQFIGDCKSVGKSHDHRFHTECLTKILLENERKRNPKVMRKIDDSGNEYEEYIPFTYYIETDNCPNQYKCRQNLIFIASICSDLLNKVFPGRKISIQHVFAQKYRFKGNWDGEGGVTKSTLKRAEESNIRSFDSISAYLNSVKILAFDSKEISPEKDNTSTINRRKFYLVTSCENVWIDALERGVDEKDMVWVERENSRLLLDATKRLEGTTKYFHFRGSDESVQRSVRLREKQNVGGRDVMRMVNKDVVCYPVFTSRIPCGCDLCLCGNFQDCVYLEKRGGVPVEPHWMRKNEEGSS